MALGLAVVALVLTVASVLNVALGLRRLKPIESLPSWSGAGARPGAPLVSIVVAARNEERGIEAGLRSLLAQTYPNLELVVVDDRSTDRTGEIMKSIVADDSRVKLVRIEELPAGWLGKNHALWVGAKLARGDWLLFVDADTVMAPETIGRATRYAVERARDHLPLLPSLVVPTVLLQAFMPVFGFFLVLWLQPWRAVNPRSRFFIGVGAFNLVRRSAYQRAGTFERIALRPDDDIKLGKILKLSGARQELLTGTDSVSVEWYHSLGELIRGLEKNAFAGLEYNVAGVLAGVVGQLLLLFGPMVGAIVTTGPARWVFLVTILVAALGFIDSTRGPKVPWHRGLLYPIVVLLFNFIALRTMVKNLVDGGIRWRDTFYPLDQLKANRV